MSRKNSYFDIGVDLMNHDYGHCTSYDEKTCPATCFRAELVRDLRGRTALLGVPLTWANFKDSEECKMAHLQSYKVRRRRV